MCVDSGANKRKVDVIIDTNSKEPSKKRRRSRSLDSDDCARSSKVDIEVEILKYVPPKTGKKSPVREQRLQCDTDDDIKIVEVKSPKMQQLQAQSVEVVAMDSPAIQVVHLANIKNPPVQVIHLDDDVSEVQRVVHQNSPASPSETESANELSDLEQNQLMNKETQAIYDATYFGM